MPHDTALRFRRAAQSRWASGLSIGLIAGLAALPASVVAQGAPVALPVAQSDRSAPRMDRLSGVWVDGPGYDIVYGVDYQACATRCLATSACAMIEFYRPEKKCNMYTSVRPRAKGGSSDVAIKR
jgi:hypothetical protein